jgi:hypothetical protein
MEDDLTELLTKFDVGVTLSFLRSPVAAGGSEFRCSLTFVHREPVVFDAPELIEAISQAHKWAQANLLGT